MEDIRNTLNLFTKSIERKDNIVTIYNYLSLLIAQMNSLYYKNNFFNSTSTCDETDKSLLLSELNAVSEKIRNLYPSFIQLRKEQFKNIFVNKLECYKKSNEFLKNIEKSNKIQSMLSDLTDLLVVDSNTTNSPIATPPAPVIKPSELPIFTPTPTTPSAPSTPSTPTNNESSKLSSNSKTGLIIFFVIFGMLLLGALFYGIFKVQTSKIKSLKVDIPSAPEPAPEK